jgi:hypothetical protein
LAPGGVLVHERIQLRHNPPGVIVVVVVVVVMAVRFFILIMRNLAKTLVEQASLPAILNSGHFSNLGHLLSLGQAGMPAPQEEKSY